MKTYQSIQDANIKNAWVTIGSFDGVHLGHQAIIREMVAAAHNQDSPAVAVTFYPHPAVVLKKIQMPFYLTEPQEKIDLLTALGLDALVILKFDLEMAAITPDAFCKQLRSHLGMRELWVGEGFTLGKDRQGSIDYLEKLGQKQNFRVHTNGLFQLNGLPVSSSLIRSLITEREVDKAASLLGRPYRVAGKVVHGEGRGHQLGTPTANLDAPREKLLPGTGIYATWLWLDRKRFPSVTNVGFRPTFIESQKKPLIEPYIMDFDQDIYGKQVIVEFLKFIRPEEKFSSVEKLKKTIKNDIQQANEVFTDAPRTPGISS